MSDAKCQGVVWNPSGQVAGWGRHVPCSKKATKDGWCGVHHPDAVAKRNTAREERWARQLEASNARQKRERRDRALIAALDALTPEEVAALPESVRALLAPAAALARVEGTADAR